MALDPSHQARTMSAIRMLHALVHVVRRIAVTCAAKTSGAKATAVQKLVFDCDA